jgi:hypothetical protein
MEYLLGRLYRSYLPKKESNVGIRPTIDVSLLGVRHRTFAAEVPHLVRVWQ